MNDRPKRRWPRAATWLAALALLASDLAGRSVPCSPTSPCAEVPRS